MKVPSIICRPSRYLTMTRAHPTLLCVSFSTSLTKAAPLYNNGGPLLKSAISSLLGEDLICSMVVRRDKIFRDGCRFSVMRWFSYGTSNSTWNEEAPVIVWGSCENSRVLIVDDLSMVSLVKESAKESNVSHEKHDIGILAYLALCIKKIPAREERNRSKDP